MQSKSSNVVIDVQGFKKCNNKFIVKELAISHSYDEFQNFKVKPPYDFEYLNKNEQKQVNWLHNNHHGLCWNEGSINFKSLQEFLIANLKNVMVYVKGNEKKVWIENLIRNTTTVYNLDDLDCPNLKTLRGKYPQTNIFECSAHIGICALRNAMLLRNFVDNDLKTEK